MTKDEKVGASVSVGVDGEENHMQAGTKRDLKARHIQMIAIGGTIGTGLFFQLGGIINAAGPVGALICYAIVGVFVYFLMMTLGEMATFLPVSASFNYYATRWVDPAAGFAMAWNYWFQWVIVAALEASFAASALKYWWGEYAYWKVSFPVLAICVIINLVGVKYYGEVEFWMSFIKVFTIMLFLIIAILVNVGVVGKNKVHGFETWATPFGGNVGFSAVLIAIVHQFVGVAFAYQGAELVGIAAGETENPKRNVPRAINNVFWRIAIFYIGGCALAGMNVPYNDPNFLEKGAAYSAFTVTLKVAGFEWAANYINFVAFSAVVSACNSDVYTSARILMGLARDGKAPAIFGKVTTAGIPLNAVMANAVLACIFLVLEIVMETFYWGWIVNLTALTGFISWGGIAYTGYCFRRAYRAQGRDESKLDYCAPFFPYAHLATVFFCVGTIITHLTFQFTDNDTLEKQLLAFSQNAISFVPFIIAYTYWKLTTGCKMVKPEEADLDSGRVERYAGEEANNDGFLDKCLSWIF